MKIKDYRNLYPLNLQMFAEGDGSGSGDGNGDGSTGGTGDGNGGNAGDGGSGDGKPLTFDDFLKDKENQSEFDRRVQKAVTTAVNNAQEKWQVLTDDKLTEAEKLAKMTKEEKANYENNKLKKELADLRKQNSLVEMAKTARAMLAEEKINVSDELLANLVSEDAESTKAAVTSFAKLFNDAVGEELKKAARQDTPKEGGSAGSGSEKLDIGKLAKEARIIK